MNPDPLIDLFKFDPALSASIRDMPNREEVIRYINIGRYIALRETNLALEDSNPPDDISPGTRDIDDAYEEGAEHGLQLARDLSFEFLTDAQSFAGLDQ